MASLAFTIRLIYVKHVKHGNYGRTTQKDRKIGGRTNKI